MDHSHPFSDKRASALTSLVNSISDNGFGVRLFFSRLGHKKGTGGPSGDISCPTIQIVTLDRWVFYLTCRNISRAGTLPQQYYHHPLSSFSITSRSPISYSFTTTQICPSILSHAGLSFHPSFAGPPEIPRDSFEALGHQQNPP